MIDKGKLFDSGLIDPNQEQQNRLDAMIESIQSPDRAVGLETEESLEAIKRRRKALLRLKIPQVE